jgi:hypothetical protein
VSYGDHVTRTKIPSDVEREDRILANLTARQVAILTAAALIVWGLWAGVGRWLPLPVLGAAAVPILSAGAGLALVQRDGIGLDRLLLAAWRQSRRPTRMVYAPEGIPAVPAWATPPGTDPGGSGPAPAPLWLPVRRVRPDGVLDLGGQGAAALVTCSTVSFALRTPEEQDALVAAFGAWLNSLPAPAQILITAERVNLTPMIQALRRDAPGLPHPALEQAALQHADFLARLETTRDLLRRRVLLVVREPYAGASRPGHRDHRRDIDGAAGRALRRAEDACRALSAAAVQARVLDPGEVVAVLAGAADPAGPPGITTQALPGHLITATTPAVPGGYRSRPADRAPQPRTAP